MREVGLVVLILISVSMIILVLMQQKSGGAGAVFGGGGGEVYRSRRGVEKLFHYFTIILAVFFSLISFGLIFVG